MLSADTAIFISAKVFFKQLEVSCLGLSLSYLCTHLHRPLIREPGWRTDKNFQKILMIYRMYVAPRAVGKFEPLIIYRIRMRKTPVYIACFCLPVWLWQHLRRFRVVVLFFVN